MYRIEREDFVEQLEQYRGHDLVKVLTGVRRCGKSTIMKMYAEKLAEEGVAPENIVLINFENPLFDDLSKNWKDAFNRIMSELDTSKQCYVFLDEVQNVERFEKLVDGLYVTDNVDVCITGSNAYLLSSELGTYLAGRYVEIKVLPLSFKEFLSGKTAASPDRAFVDYLQIGSLPETLVLHNDSSKLVSSYLDGIVSSILTKDVMLRSKLYDKSLLERVIRFLFDSTGSEISVLNIANNIAPREKPVSSHTVAKILDALVESFLFYKVNRYDIKGKKLLKTNSKFYPVDLGLRNKMLGKTGESDIGHALESVVYFELLRRGNTVHIGKVGETEVDFVARTPEGFTHYYQVSYSTKNEQTIARELRPLKMINDFNARTLITMDIEPVTQTNGIQKVNAIDWLLE